MENSTGLGRGMIGRGMLHSLAKHSPAICAGGVSGLLSFPRSENWPQVLPVGRGDEKLGLTHFWDAGRIMPMQPQEFEDAKLLWKKYYAVQCLKHAQAAAEYILQNKIQENDPVFFPLITAVYVLYGRPFKKTKGVGLLGAEIIPQEHLKFHKLMLDHRDQIYAHSDAIGFEVPNVGQANQIRAVSLPTETRLLRSQYQAHPELLPHIIKLCQELQEKTLAHVNQLFAQYEKQISAKFGEYVLNIDDPAGPFFKPATPVIRTIA